MLNRIMCKSPVPNFMIHWKPLTYFSMKYVLKTDYRRNWDGGTCFQWRTFVCMCVYEFSWCHLLCFIVIMVHDWNTGAEHWWMILTEKAQSTWRRICPCVILYTTNLMWTALGWNLVFRGSHKNRKFERVLSDRRKDRVHGVHNWNIQTPNR